MQLFSLYSTKFMRPRLAKHVLERPEIIARLRQALTFPLTVVRAGAGYGKSTLINQAFPEDVCRAVWLNLSEQETAVLQFLQHLIYAVNERFPGLLAKSLQALVWDERQGLPDPLKMAETFAHELRDGLREATVLVLEDFQYVGNAPEVLKLTEALIDLLPANIHIIITSRAKVRLPNLTLRRARGEVLEIGEDDLAFDENEIIRLLRLSCGVAVDKEMAARLTERTEGWVMAIHMIGERLAKGERDEALSGLPQSMRELFEFLLADYLAKQPTAIRAFLSYTARMQFIQSGECDSILGIDNSAEILRDLEARCLFTFCVGDEYYRYHHLFQEYLQKALPLPPAELAAFYRRAAAYYQNRGLYPVAVEYFLAGGHDQEAGQLIGDTYQDVLAGGRQSDIERWLRRIPAEVSREIPELQVCQGDLFRLAGNFSAALKLYGLAERGFARQNNPVGKYMVAKAFALVYLDTVQPLQAEEYLKTALASVGENSLREKAQLYQLLAENKINLGRSEEADLLFRQANELYLEESRGDLEARMHLRTGRLATAKNILARQENRKPAFRLPRSHRETPLLLSLINAFMGEVDEAGSNAKEGLAIGKQLKASFVEAVGYMRLGHAKQLGAWAQVEEAAACYHQALEITSSLGVERGKAEPLCGLCLLYGHHGNLDRAVSYGLEGLRVGEAARDDWMSAMIQLALGVAYYVNDAPAGAGEWIDKAQASFVRCGDSYLSAAAMLWQAKLRLDGGLMDEFAGLMDALLLRTQSHGYDFLFYRPTFLGLRDIQAATPVLLAAQRANIRQAYAGSLLTELGVIAGTPHHPGYTLRVQALGDFRVWRGLEELRPKAWQREKARRLFQFLLTNRHKLLHKEEIIEVLWGEEGADNDFKVALNALLSALEPGRNARTAPYYISKQGASYGLNLAVGINLDVDEFESYINRGDRIIAKDEEQGINLYRLALNLYGGDYLPECRYDDWTREERERLLLRYIAAAEKLAGLLYVRGELEECIGLCGRILAKDRCWEKAYQLLMRCYHRQNNRSMVVRVFKQCRESLQCDLGVQPSTETLELFTGLTN